MSNEWLQQNLSVVNTANGPDQNSSREGDQGLIQQYGNSCGPTSVQVVRAQNDPIYALKLRSAGPVEQAPPTALTDPETITNAPAASEQKAILDAHAATGAGNAPTNRTNPAGGAWVESDLNALSGVTGVTYKTAMIGTGSNAITIDQAIRTLDVALVIGITVPVVIGSSPGATSHYVVAMQKSGSRYQFHDVATGETVWRTNAQIRTGAMNMPSGHTMLTAVDVPGPAQAATP